MTRLLMVLLVATVGLCASAQRAGAQTCVFTMSNIVFANVELLGAGSVDSAGTLSAVCTLGGASKTVRVCAGISEGGGGAIAGGTRTMQDLLGNKLEYQLYANAGRTTVWGSNSWAYNPPYPAIEIDVPLNALGTGSASATVYGRILSGQATTPPGAYTSAFLLAQTQMSYAYTTAGLCGAQTSPTVGQAAFTVTAVNLSNCIVGASTLDFGPRSVLSANIDATGSIVLTCTRTVAYTVGLGGGGAGATTPAGRRMTSGANSVGYGLYGNAARTQGWLDTGGNFQGSGTGSGLPQSLPVYGRVPPQTTPAQGLYSDSVVVTVTY